MARRLWALRRARRVLYHRHVAAPETETTTVVQPVASRLRRSWSTYGWLLAAIVLAVAMVALFRGVRDHEAGLSIATALAQGERPAAPSLPTERLAGTAGRGAPLPQLPKPGAAAGVTRMRAPVVVNWWASWCGPCREEAGVLNRLSERYEDEGVRFVGVNAAAEDLGADAQAFAQRYRIRYALVRGSARDKGLWGVRGFPETFLIGRDGRISVRIDGPVDERALQALLERELSGRLA